MRHGLPTIAVSVLLFCALDIQPLTGQELVIVRDGSKEFHRPGCESIQGRSDVLAMQRTQAEARGFKAHKECDPAYVPPPPKPVMVVVDEGGKYYHREKCTKIGKGSRSVTLEQAARKQWPCTSCKPPIRPRRKPDG